MNIIVMVKLIFEFLKIEKIILSMLDICFSHPRSQYKKKSPNADGPLIWSYLFRPFPMRFLMRLSKCLFLTMQVMLKLLIYQVSRPLTPTVWRWSLQE